jgi:hypothetical protein
MQFNRRPQSKQSKRRDPKAIISTLGKRTPNSDVFPQLQILVSAIVLSVASVASCFFMICLEINNLRRYK